MSLNKYRIRCLTEAAYVYAWGDSLITKCPNDQTHTIDPAMTTIVESQSVSEVQLTGKLTSDGLPLVSSIPGVDSTNMCFCQGASAVVSTSLPFIQWQNSYSHIQLSGVSVWTKDAEPLDKLNFEVGYYVSGNWTPVTRYGDNIAILTDPWFMERRSDRVSNPIPQGLYLRVNYIFANPSTTNTPKVSVVYHLQRPYV